METIPDYIALYDAEGRYEFLNHYAEGYSAKDVVGKHYSLFLPEASRRLYDQAIERIRQTGKTEFIEYEAPGDRGVSRHYDSYIVPIFEQDALTHFMVIARDISERKQAEEKLRLSEEQFSKAFHTSPAGMTITRIADGKFIDANDSFLKMFELDRAEVIGHTSTELNMWTPEERKKLIEQQLESGGLRDFELQARSKSGRIIHILFSSKPIELEGEACHVTTMLDITDRKQAEEELRLSRDRLAELSRQLVQTHETESRAIGRELHDQIGQMLTALKLTLKIAPQLPSDQTAQKIMQARELVDDLLNRVRLEVYVEPSRDVRADADRMEIQIEDDGVGFNVEPALAQNRGLGGMRERVGLLNGTFRVQSETGRGARLHITLPLKETA